MATSGRQEKIRPLLGHCHDARLGVRRDARRDHRRIHHTESLDSADAQSFINHGGVVNAHATRPHGMIGGRRVSADVLLDGHVARGVFSRDAGFPHGWG